MADSRDGRNNNRLDILSVNIPSDPGGFMRYKKRAALLRPPLALSFRRGFYFIHANYIKKCRKEKMNLNAPILSRTGNTPIMRIFETPPVPYAAGRNIYAKIESAGAGFSVKDRAALFMIHAAIAENKIRKNVSVIEPTSGNTGIGLAMICAALKIKLKLVMPETMSIERRKIINHFGAEIILSDGGGGMKKAIEKAEEIAANEPDKYFMPRQFDNPANPAAHRATTAIEFLNFMGLYSLRPDALVFGVGTGGTLTGVSEVVLKRYPNVIICAVEPENSAVLSGGKPGAHKIQGIGAGFIPAILNTAIINKIIKIKDETAFKYCRLLAQNDGLLAGLSSGAAAAASCEIARELPSGANIFTLFPDSAERYLSLL